MALASRDGLIRRKPIVSYFVLAYFIAWLGALVVVAPYWMRGEPVPRFSGLMMFPAMLLGPSIAGIVLTWWMGGMNALRDLLSRMRRIGSVRWLAVLVVPPAVVAGVLLVLAAWVAPVFVPNRFPFGFLFGCAAGFFEELGWMGFAFPAMRRQQSALGAAVSLGLLWGLWHAPVLDYLGSATPHGNYGLPFFLSFTAAMTAMRVLICWVYSNTGSVLQAQLLHASSTGALATFSPIGVTARQEAMWYAVYAVILWTIVGCVVLRFGTTLQHRRSGRALT